MRSLRTLASALAIGTAVFVTDAPLVHAAPIWHECHVGDLWDATGYEAQQYLHAHCVEGVNVGGIAIFDFVIPTSDRERSTRFFNLATAALLSGRTFVVMFDSVAEIHPGCSSINCRVPRYFGLRR